MSTEDKNLTLRFLDIEHVLTKENNKSFFHIINFTKKNRCKFIFLNGKSFHPLNIFILIITCKRKYLTNEIKIKKKVKIN